MYTGFTIIECIRVFGATHGVDQKIIDARVREVRRDLLVRYTNNPAKSVHEATPQELEHLPGAQGPVLIVALERFSPRYIHLAPYKSMGVVAMDLRVSVFGDIGELKVSGRGRDPNNCLGDQGGFGVHIADTK